MSYRLLAHPSSIGRVLDSGFKLFLGSFRPVIGLVLVAAAVSIIMQYAMFLVMVPRQPFTTPEQSQAYLADAMPLIFTISIVMMVLNIIIYNAILVRVGDIALNRQGDMVGAILTGLKKTFPVLFGFILYGLAVAGGFIVLVIPGLIFMLTLLFFQLLIVLDDEGIVESLKTSHKLVWGNYWRTAAVIMIPLFVIYALIAVLAFIAGISTAVSMPESMDAVMPMRFGLVDAISAGVPALMIPLMYSVYIVQLNDLKLRKSGVDLLQRLES